MLSKLLPITVLLIGILSIILLLWVERVSERLHMYEVLVDTVMDVQIHISKYHLLLEEAISDGASVDMQEDFALIDQAIILVDTTLMGGERDKHRIVWPFQDPELRSRAESVKSLLLRLRVSGLERLRERAKTRSGSSLEGEFHALYKEAHRILGGMETMLESREAANQEKSRRLFQVIMIIWSFIVIAAVGGLWNRETRRKFAEDALLRSNGLLLLQTEELTEHREHLAELVQKRTGELTAANEKVAVEMAERLQTFELLKQSERQIRELSTNLLTAQEVERRRISMELHDELGQALTAMKFRVRIMERGLRDDQGELRNDCETLLEYMNAVLEDVRRLSLALSPTVLEDLGLTSALRWLINNFSEISGVQVTSDIDDVDLFVVQKQWVTFYRIMQEALTNVGKHSQAEQVSIVLRHDEQTVVFSIEDDGKGFDTKQTMTKDASGNGLGLATMAERAQILGGVFEIFSREEKGTLISVSIPIAKGEA